MRSVSYSTCARAGPSIESTWNAIGAGSVAARGRRRAMSAALSGTHSVSMKSLPKAGWPTSSASEPRAIST